MQRIEYLPVEQLSVHPSNPRKIDERQMKILSESIATNPDYFETRPILCNKDHVIFAGNMRFLAAKQLGLAEVPVAVMDITPEREREIMIRDNRQNGMWDFDLLANEFDVTELMNWGFDEKELVGGGMEVFPQDDKDDEVPALPMEPESKLGDLYILGEHRILCGDATIAEDVKRLMGDREADLVFTDPPYNVNYKGGGAETTNTIMNNNMSEGDFGAFLQHSFLRMGEVCKQKASWYVCHSHDHQDTFRSAISKTPWRVKAQIIWEKPSATMGWQEYRSRHELIFYCVTVQGANFYGDRTNTTVWKQEPDDRALTQWLKRQLKKDFKGTSTIWTIGRENVNDYQHPTQKPVALVGRAIINSTREEDVILDPFLGSGTTLISAEKARRACFGMELDPRYVDVVVKRWEDSTGQKAVKM